MNADLQVYFKDELAARRERLNAALTTGAGGPLPDLLREVDLALERIERGEFGLCETCHESIEKDRLIADPLLRFCLDHLTERQQRALEQDLELASRIQRGLLPRSGQTYGPWDIDFWFEPAGPVSGDYCDLIPCSAGEMLFLLGDVSGKGVAASMLMSHLHGMFRSLASVGLPLDALMERAGRMFCESTLPTHYATLIAGRAQPDGGIEVCNAGHLPALVFRREGIEESGATSLPLGLFCEGNFPVEKRRLGPGESIVLYSDGVTEAEDSSGAEFGSEGLRSVVRDYSTLPARSLVELCRARLDEFVGGRPPEDDRTLLVLRFDPSPDRDG